MVGVTLGVCWLYRPDFGTSEFLGSLIILGLIEAADPGRSLARLLQAGGLLAGGFAIAPLAWLGYLALRIGPLAPLDYLETTIQATVAVSGAMSQPPPAIRSVLLAYWLIPASYLFGFFAVVRRIWTGGTDTRSWFLLASSMIGMGCLHQALHRMDPGHLLQVLTPAIVCGSLIASWLLCNPGYLGVAGRAERYARVAGVVYATLLVLIGCKLSRWGQCDLDAFSFRPLERYSRLAGPLAHSDGDPRLSVLSSIMEQTKPWEPILAFPLDSQFYALTQRRMSGRLHAYYAGVFDSLRWREGNLEAIQAEMPKLVIVPADFDTEPGEIDDNLVCDSRRAHAYLERFIRQNYPRVVLCDGGIMVLSR